MRDTIISSLALVIYYGVVILSALIAVVVTLPALGMFNLYQWAKRQAPLEWKRPIP
jgi:hypothetical protein